MSAARICFRIYLASGARIGPGKVAILEEIARSGSIAAAGRSLGISYRQIWKLLEELNDTLGSPVVAGIKGGADGGGSTLTPLGKEVVDCYRAIEGECAVVVHEHLLDFEEVHPPAAGFGRQRVT
jgi:molybdate transport system regulatory protein